MNQIWKGHRTKRFLYYFSMYTIYPDNLSFNLVQCDSPSIMNYFYTMKKQTGFTLIELVITMAVFGIVLATALPSLDSFVASNRRSANINIFVGSLNLSRSEAVKRNTPVSICTSNNGTACNNALSWEDGWLVFVDFDGDGVVDAGDGDEIIRVFAKLNKRSAPTKDVIITEIDTASPGLKKITYQSRGGVDNQATFVRCADLGNTVKNDAQARAVIVSVTGRVRLSKRNKQRDNTTNLPTCPWTY